MTPTLANNIERKTAPDKREVFFNYGEIRYTVNDFLLQFSLIRNAAPSAEPGTTVTITNILDVTCSPQNVKSLSVVLSNMIATYEKQYGLIPSDPAIAGPATTGPVN